MMKVILKGVLVLLFSTQAFAATLNCWKTDFKPPKVKKPFMTAEIISNDVLRDIRFLYKNTETQDAWGNIQGDLITSNHSPYKGNNKFILNANSVLILPTDLSNKNLISIEVDGIGQYRGENGVIIGYSTGLADTAAGTHYSYRLRCRSK